MLEPPMLDPVIVQSFDKIYATDLVYVSNCWKLCGDAHCCSFARYKAKFKLIARTPFQELPLLPGEYAYLQAKGWLAQFGDHDHKVIEYALDTCTLKIESIISRRPHCACDHATRPIVCRLYPLLPVFTIHGTLSGVETYGIYEELEQIEGLAPACQLTTMPFDELSKFLTITSEIAKNPHHLYYLEAYRLTKAHVRAQLLYAKSTQQDNVFFLFEKMLIRKQVVNHVTLKSTLQTLATQFRAAYGPRFTL
jgi:hypothetical protein